MGPHVAANEAKADSRKQQSGEIVQVESIKSSSGIRENTDRSTSSTTTLTSTTASLLSTEGLITNLKIEKLAETTTRANRRRSQRVGCSRGIEEEPVTGCGSSVSTLPGIANTNTEAISDAVILEQSDATASSGNSMAPALNEPMSPADKLPNSNAKATPTTRSIKRGIDTESTTPLPVINTCTSGSNNSGHREKKARNSTSTPTQNSTRLTRSKDACQRVSDQTGSLGAANTPQISAKEESNTSALPSNYLGTADSSAKVKSVCNSGPAQQSEKNSDETIGLSVVLHNNNNNNGSSGKSPKTIEGKNLDSEASHSELPTKHTKASLNNNNNNDTNINCKSNSTEQLLADLTNDFEEAITEGVESSKQTDTADKSGVNVSQFDSVIEAETKDILLSTGESNASGDEAGVVIACFENATSSPVTPTTHSTELDHMESGSKNESRSHEFCSGLITKKQTEESIASSAEKSIKDGNAASTTAKEAVNSNATITPVDATLTVSSEELKAVVDGSEVGRSRSKKTEGGTRLQILSVDVLPPISTDSTMTASEVEDNLEERLSQLDGTAISSPPCDDSHIDAGVVDMDTIRATPPRTPPKQQTHQQQVQQLQQQLQHTPPTPLSQHVHQQQQQHLHQHHTFTPQSSSSSVNTISSTNLPPAFMKESGAGELEDQDIEEVLKALKGFDGSAGADTLCDLNVLFNEEYTLNYEEVSSQPASTTTKPSPLKEMQSEIERKQQTMHRKIDFLLRRLRKLQARYMSKHCSEEIAGLFEWSARIAAGKCGTINAADPSCHDNAISVIAARPPASNWADEKNPVPSAQMSSMLRRLEQSSNAQQLCTMTVNTSISMANVQFPRKSKKALLQEMQAAASTSAAALATSPALERKGEIVVPNYDVNVSEEMAQVAGLLQTEMREVQTAMDSDATESSSGGESADEVVTYNNQIQQPLHIAKRAAWRYSRDRAAIAARWSWLLSQIADLEIKIRQHSELHQEIVRTKGPVVCGLEEQYVSDGTSGLKAFEAVTPSAATTSSVNGYKGNINSLVGTSLSGKLETIDPDESGLPGASRTRGFVPTQFRKRKLLQTQSLHTISKKAARPSNIKCGCQWPLNPCALCTGRLDPTAPRDPPDTMMMADRVALLDPGYHPVLSFREDVSNTLHLEAIARMPDWQQRVMRCQVKSIAKSVWKAERQAERAAGHNTSKKYGESTVKRRYTKKKDRLLAEEKNATAAIANSSNASTSTASLAADTSTIQETTVSVGGGGILADTSAFGANATSSITALTSLPACDAGNGTGTLSTSTTTTPLVANKWTKNSKKMHHYHLVGDGVLLEPPQPLSPVATNHSSHSQSSHNSQQSGNSNSNYIHQTSDYPPQNYDTYNPSPIHSSLISSNSNGYSGSGGVGGGNHKYNNSNNKYRKSSTTSAAVGISNSNTSFYHHNTLSSHYNNYNSEINDANWDGFAARSRTSSPTHASGGGKNSNYHKYERSKNRTSYDIDNIVIPYSVAAATRVEILPYKEIPTPKWRVIEENQEQAMKNADIAKQDAAGVGDIIETGVMTIDDSVNVLEKDAQVLTEKVKTAGEETSLAEETAKAQEAGELNSTGDNSTKDDMVTPFVMNNSLVIDTKNTAERKSNNVLKKNCNAVTKVELKSQKQNVKSEIVTSVVAPQSEEPVVKKLKSDGVDKSTKACTDENGKVAAANREPRNKVPNAATTNVRASVSKRTQRLKRSSILQAEPEDVDPVAEAAEVEDITDDAIMLRHERALAEERRKFQTYLKFPWSTRSRANRRIDSRAESSGANTPDPTSPAPHTPSVGGGDQESIPSPLAPSTPLNPSDTISETGENSAMNLTSNANGGASCNTIVLSKHLERRRTTSTKKDRELERRSTTPDPKEFVPPYEPLKYPLTDEAFEGLLKAMPVEFHCLDFDSKYLEDCNNFGGAVTNTRYSRQRSSWRGEVSAVCRRGKSGTTTITQNCDATNNKRQRINNNAISCRKGGGGGRRRRCGNYTRGRNDDEFENGVHGVDGGVADFDEGAEDEDDLMMLLAEEEDDYDYPKHHLAPDDDLYDSVVGGSTAGGGGLSNGGVRNRMMDFDDEYEAYVGRQHRDRDVDTSDSEPFADDDPNDPEWHRGGEERSGGAERQRRVVR